jgi:hypothetical protein
MRNDLKWEVGMRNSEKKRSKGGMNLNSEVGMRNDLKWECGIRKKSNLKVG